MKIIYFSNTFFADCDFPLIREMQKRGYDVEYYLPIAPHNLKSNLLKIDKIYPHTGIYKATVYDGFKLYENELDLSKVFVVNKLHKQKYHPLNIILMMRLVFRFIKQKPDIIHITSEPSFMIKLLYLVANKLVLTIHDPFLHSSSFNKQWEKRRKIAYSKIKRLVLLNKMQVDEFIKYYKVPKDHIFINRLGVYDTITHITPKYINIKKPYILFFGGINKYKGLDCLMKAMVEVHKKYPKLTLVVAGGGKLWFDIKSYQKLSYFDLRIRYIDVPELAGLLQECEFSVCPYRDATQSGVVQTALSMNVPLIVTNVGALPEVVEDGKYGVVVEPNDVMALSNAICELHSKPETLNYMREQIKNKWLPTMSWKPIVDKYIECYKTIK